MKYKKRNTNDRLFEAGEDIIFDIPDEEVETAVKNRLTDIINNPRLFAKYRSDLYSMLDDFIQNYAEEKYYSQKDEK